MTAHVVKLQAKDYPITSWKMSVNGKSYDVPSNSPIKDAKTDTITFKVVNNPNGVEFAPNAFCAVEGKSKPTPNQACDGSFSQKLTKQGLEVTDNGSAGEYYYTIKFNKDYYGKDVGPLDPIIIHERPGGTALWSTATIVEVAAVAVVLVLVALFAWRRLRT